MCLYFIALHEFSFLPFNRSRLLHKRWYPSQFALPNLLDVNLYESKSVSTSSRELESLCVPRLVRRQSGEFVGQPKLVQGLDPGSHLRPQRLESLGLLLARPWQGQRTETPKVKWCRSNDFALTYFGNSDFLQSSLCFMFVDL